MIWVFVNCCYCFYYRWGLKYSRCNVGVSDTFGWTVKNRSVSSAKLKICFFAQNKRTIDHVK